MKIDMTEFQPAFYINEKGEPHTTGVFVSFDDESRVFTQLKKEIADIENENIEDICIHRCVEYFSVGVKGRFTPIGRVYVLAMLDPDR